MHFSLVSLLFLGTVSAQLSCGGASKAICGKAEPCCSEYGICGRTPLHCGGGCQSQFSYAPNLPNGSCYVDREQSGRKCISGKYTFGVDTWMQNAEAYNGDPRTADFVVENVQNIALAPGSATVQIQAPNPVAKDKPGVGVRVSSTSYMMYGKFSAKIKAAYTGGVVTAFISMSDDRDEIDWEWTGGKDINKAQTNFFIKGAIDYTKSVSVDTGASTAEVEHEYTVDWTKDTITWFIDGKQVRSVANHKINTPARIQFSVWDGGYGAEGTRLWAGGYIDWAASKTYKAVFSEVKIQCPGEPEPAGPPTRPANFQAPSLSDAKIDTAVPGLPGYKSSGTSGIPSSTAGNVEDVTGNSFVVQPALVFAAMAAIALLV